MHECNFHKTRKNSFKIGTRMLTHTYIRPIGFPTAVRGTLLAEFRQLFAEFPPQMFVLDFMPADVEIVVQSSAETAFSPSNFVFPCRYYFTCVTYISLSYSRCKRIRTVVINSIRKKYVNFSVS
jgi:hypothetical protein